MALGMYGIFWLIHKAGYRKGCRERQAYWKREMAYWKGYDEQEKRNREYFNDR